MSAFIARTGTNVLPEHIDPNIYGSFALTLGSSPVHHHEWHFESAAQRDRFLKDYADGTLRKPVQPVTAKDLDL